VAVDTLQGLSRTEREEYLWEVFREAESFRQGREDGMIRVFRYLRDLADPDTPYRTRMRHPYAFSAAQTIKAMIYPVLFSADPAVQIIDPNPDNYDRNQIAEELLTGHLKNPLRTNFPVAFEKVCDDAIWFGWSAPWTWFRSETRVVGPRFEPRLAGGTQFLDDIGNAVVDEVYEEVPVYHAPWLEPVDVWDTFLHPDGRRGFTRRDVTGYELLAQSSGANPMYDRERVLLMINREIRAKTAKSVQKFGDGSASFMERDQLSMEAGAEPPRHSELESSRWEKDVLARPFVVLHYDDGNSHGTYAVASTGGLMELRFFRGVNYDGSPNRLFCRTWQSPQELYGTSFFEVARDLLDFHSNIYRAAGDAAALQVHPVFVASQQFRMSGQQPVFGPGAIIYTPTTVRSPDEHFKRLDTGMDFFQTFQLADNAVKRDLDLVFSQGDPQRGIFEGGRRTAYETSIVSAGAQGRIEVLVKKMFNEFVVPLCRKWLAMMSQHYTGRDYRRMLGSRAEDYSPPTITEIVSSLSYVPKGSITLSDTQTRRAQWPAIFDASLKSLPYMQIPHIRELFRRMLEDMGQEAVTRAIPSEGDPRFTEYQSRIMNAMSMGGGEGAASGAPSPPRSPTDISGLLRSLGGATAPPGPAGQGIPNGSQNGR
jgi:hypothetical protein